MDLSDSQNFDLPQISFSSHRTTSMILLRFGGEQRIGRLAGGLFAVIN